MARKNPADVVQERVRRLTQKNPLGEPARIPMTRKGAGPIETYGQMIEDKLRGARIRREKRNREEYRRNIT